MTEVSSDAAAVLADHRRVLDGVENTVDAVGNLYDEAGEELLPLRLRTVQQRVVFEGQFLGVAVDLFRHTRIHGQARPRAEEAWGVEQEAPVQNIVEDIPFQSAQPQQIFLSPREIGGLRACDGTRNAPRELLERVFLPDSPENGVVPARKIALIEKPQGVLGETFTTSGRRG